MQDPTTRACSICWKEISTHEMNSHHCVRHYAVTPNTAFVIKSSVNKKPTFHPIRGAQYITRILEDGNWKDKRTALPTSVLEAIKRQYALHAIDVHNPFANLKKTATTCKDYFIISIVDGVVSKPTPIKITCTKEFTSTKRKLRYQLF